MRSHLRLMSPVTLLEEPHALRARADTSCRVTPADGRDALARSRPTPAASRRPGQRRWGLIVPFGALAAVLLAAAQPARACIRIGPLKLEGYPRDGAQDVPLDVLPIYQLTMVEFAASSGSLSDGIRLGLDGGLAPVVSLPDGGAVPLNLGGYQVPEANLSHAGGSVAIKLRYHGNHFEIVPDGLLSPDTQYTLEVRWQDKEDPNSLANSGPLTEKRASIHFRTGDTPYAGDAHAPAVSATQFVGVVSSCDPVERSVCFSLPDDEALYQAQFEGDPFVMIARGSFFSTRPYTDREDKLDCMIIRQRLPNGALGDPARSCRAERALLDVDQLDDAEEGIVGLDCKSGGLYLVDRPLAELFREQEQRAERERAELTASAESESEGAEPEGDGTRRAREASDCSLAPSRHLEPSRLGTLWVALSASVLLRRRRRR